MPRYITQATSAVKPTHTKAYSFALNSLSAAATQIENTFALGSTVNVKNVRLNSVVYPYSAGSIRYNDSNCFAYSIDGTTTIPYTPQHVFTDGSEKAFSLVAWVKVAGLAPACPIFAHGSEYELSLTGTQEVQFTVYTDAGNYIRVTSTETVSTDTWVCVAVTYNPSAGSSADLTGYINGTACTPVDGDTGVFTGQTDGTASSFIGFIDVTYGEGYFGDLVLFNKSLTSYEVTSLYNSGAVKNIGAAPIAISRYTFGDHADDTIVILTDVIGGHDGASTGGVTIALDAAGGGADNVAQGSQTGTLIVAIRNIPELRDFYNGAATVLGQSVSYTGTWGCPFIGSSAAGTFENYWAEEQQALVTLDNQAYVNSLQVRATYQSSDLVGTASTVLPQVQWPGHVTVNLSITYEEI